jgi:hypothetical protein
MTPSSDKPNTEPQYDAESFSANTSKTSQKPGGKEPARPFSRVYFKLLLFISVLLFVAFGLSGYLYQLNVLGLGGAMSLLRYSAYAAMGVGIIGVISLFFAARSRFKKRHLFYSMMAVVLCGFVSGVALYWSYQADNHPFLHDISTDTENPPEFDVIDGLRADAPNPPEYPGEEAAEIQREGYPDIITTYMAYDRSVVFHEALALIESRGWSLAQADEEEGIIEATETLPWFGFKDDVVIRLQAERGRTIFDMRSKSRVGGTDLGVNAKRITTFIEDLRMRLRQRPASQTPAEESQEDQLMEEDAERIPAPDSLAVPEAENGPESEQQPVPEPEQPQAADSTQTETAPEVSPEMESEPEETSEAQPDTTTTSGN